MDDESNDNNMFILNSENYWTWKTRMEDLLCVRELYETIESKDAVDGIDEREWKYLNRKAVAIIRQFVDDSVYQNVAIYTNAFELWSKLESMYGRKSVMSQVFMMRKLSNLKYKDGESMGLYLSNFQLLVNELIGSKVNLDDELQASLLLTSLPYSYDSFVTLLSNSAPSGKLTMEIVKGSLLVEEATRRDLSSSSKFGADMVHDRSRGMIKNGDACNRDKSRGRSNSNLKSKVICYHCQNLGHIKKFCPTMKRKKDHGEVRKQ